MVAQRLTVIVNYQGNAESSQMFSVGGLFDQQHLSYSWRMRQTVIDCIPSYLDS